MFDRPQHTDHGQDKPNASKGISPQKIQQLLEDPNLRLFDLPAVMAMGHQLIVHPDDPELQALFIQNIEQRAAQIAAMKDPFMANCPPLGTSLCDHDDARLMTISTGDPVGLAPTSIFSNLLAAGPTGGGKTTMIQRIIGQLPQHGFVVVCFDRKREHRCLLNHPLLWDCATVLDMRDLKISLYQPIADIPWRSTAPMTTELIAKATGRMYAQRFLHETVEEILAGQGSDHGIALSHLIEAVRFRSARGGWRIGELKESILMALIYLRTYLGEVFQCRRSDLLERLFTQPGIHIIELAVLPADMHGFLVSLMMQWLYLFRLHKRNAPRTPVVFVVDDATVTVDRRTDAQSIGGVSPMTEQMMMGRGLDMGVIVGVHAPSSASEKIIRNCQNMLFTSGRGENPRFLQNLLGLTPEQAAFARTMQPGQLVGLMPSKWPQPLMGVFPDQGLQTPGDAACHASTNRFLAGVHTKAAAATTPVGDRNPTPSSTTTSRVSGNNPGQSGPRDHGPSSQMADSRDLELDPKHLKALVQLTEPLPPILTEWYQRLGLSTGAGRTMVRNLESKGFIRLHTFKTGQRGQPKVAELTSDGWDLLERKQLVDRSAKPTHGGFEHNLAAESLRRIGKKNGWDVDFEVQVGDVRIDVRWRNDRGKCIFYQIGVSKPEREAQAIVKAASHKVIRQNKLVLIARDHAFIREVEKKVAKAMHPLKASEIFQGKLIGALMMKAR